MRGRYADALRLYEEALGHVEHADVRGRPGAPAEDDDLEPGRAASTARRRRARARSLCADRRPARSMQPSEEAQLLVNQGTLLRRLGDPIKAMQTYRQAQALFARAQHRDGEIGTWRNIGIAYALDLNDSPRALDAFDTRADAGAAVVEPARRSPGPALPRRDASPAWAGWSDASGELPGRPRRRHRRRPRRRAVEGALRPRPDCRSRRPRRRGAASSYERAIAAIESVRADLQAVPLRSEFLADKRDVYDALIALRLASPRPRRPRCSRSSSRAARAPGRTVFSPAASGCRSRACSRRLPPERCCSSTGAVRPPRPWCGSPRPRPASSGRRRAPDDLDAVQRFADVVSRPGDDWRAASRRAGRILLSGLPDLAGVTRLLVVPDGPLHAVPFEALTAPGSTRSARRAVRDRLPAVGRAARPEPLGTAGPP